MQIFLLSSFGMIFKNKLTQLKKTLFYFFWIDDVIFQIGNQHYVSRFSVLFLEEVEKLSLNFIFKSFSPYIFRIQCLKMILSERVTDHKILEVINKAIKNISNPKLQEFISEFLYHEPQLIWIKKHTVESYSHHRCTVGFKTIGQLFLSFF